MSLKIVIWVCILVASLSMAWAGSSYWLQLVKRKNDVVRFTKKISENGKVQSVSREKEVAILEGNSASKEIACTAELRRWYRLTRHRYFSWDGNKEDWKQSDVDDWIRQRLFTEVGEQN